MDRRLLVGIALRRWFAPRPRIIPHKIAQRLGLPDPQAGPEGSRTSSASRSRPGMRSSRSRSPTGPAVRLQPVTTTGSTGRPLTIALDRGARRVITTAEALDEESRRLILGHLGEETYAIHGTTELGTVGWERRAHACLHLAEESILPELLPVAGGREACRVVATGLLALTTPIIRYDTGDLASRASREPCRCASRLARVGRLEGRLVDSVRLIGRRLLSPFVLTEAIEGVDGLSGYQIVQEKPARILVRLERCGGEGATAKARVLARLGAALGEPVDITVRWCDRLEAEPGTKFKVVERRPARPGTGLPCGS
jgi:hypothetical protein